MHIYGNNLEVALRNISTVPLTPLYSQHDIPLKMDVCTPTLKTPGIPKGFPGLTPELSHQSLFPGATDSPSPKLTLLMRNKESLRTLLGRGMANSRAILRWQLQNFYTRARPAHPTLCFGSFVSSWHSNFKTVHKTPFNYLALYRFYITLEVTDSIHFASNYKTD